MSTTGVSRVPAAPAETKSGFKFTRVHGLIASFLVALIVQFSFSGIPANTHRALTITVLTMALWICDVFPMEMTAILYSVLLVGFNVLPVAKAFGGYSDPTPWFILSVLVFGIAVNESGLGKRLALNLSRAFGASFWGMMAALLLSGLILGFFTPMGMERMLILYPLALGIGTALLGPEKMVGSNITKLAMSGTFIAGNQFGFGILTGTAVNMVAVGVIKQVTGMTILWRQWFAWFFLPVILTGVITMLVLARMFPPEKPEVAGGRERITDDLRAMGKMSSREIKTLIFLVVAILLWITDFKHGIAAWQVSIVVAVLMTAPGFGCVAAKDLKKIPLNIVVFSCAALTIGIAVKDTGLGTWMGNVTLAKLIHPGMSASVTSAITYLVTAVLHIPLGEGKTTVAAVMPVVADYFHASGMPITGPVLMAMMASVNVAFVPFMSLASLFLMGLGPHFNYKWCTITVCTYSIVGIVVNVLGCFTFYRWLGLT